MSRIAPRALVVEVLRSGTAAGLAMMPFGFAFRAAGMRINEYGPKTLALVLGELAPPWSTLAGLAQHFVISWAAAVPLLLTLAQRPGRAARAVLGAAYGAGFYVLVNSLALPLWFGDPTPWELGARTVAPSFIVHVVYGVVVAAVARVGRTAPGAR